MAIASLAGGLALSSPALAQGEPDVQDPVELTPEEKQAQAIELFKAGQADLDAENYSDAIDKFTRAFELFPDPGLQVKIGEAYQRDGSASLDYDKLRSAVEAYKKFVELVPEGDITDGVNGRILELQESIDAEDQRLARVADEEARQSSMLSSLKRPRRRRSVSSC